MFGFFKPKETTYKKTIIATSEEVKQSKIKQEAFLKEANTCPECGFLNDMPFIGYKSDGVKYTVKIDCQSCGCKFEYERPCKF